MKIHEPPTTVGDGDDKAPQSNPRGGLMPLHLRVPRNITEEQAREFKRRFPDEYETWWRLAHR